MPRTYEVNLTEEYTPDKDEILYMFYINEEKLNTCPRVLICIGNQRIPAVIDTGSQISLLTEELYHELRSEGVEGLELGVQNALFVSAFRNKSKRICVQAMMPIRIDDMVVDHIFLVSPQLLTQALLLTSLSSILQWREMVRCPGITSRTTIIFNP